MSFAIQSIIFLYFSEFGSRYSDMSSMSLPSIALIAFLVISSFMLLVERLYMQGNINGGQAGRT